MGGGAAKVDQSARSSHIHTNGSPLVADNAVCVNVNHSSAQRVSGLMMFHFLFYSDARVETSAVKYLTRMRYELTLTHAQNILTDEGSTWHGVMAE